MFFSETVKILVTSAFLFFTCNTWPNSKAVNSWRYYVMKSIVIQYFTEDKIPGLLVQENNDSTKKQQKRNWNLKLIRFYQDMKYFFFKWLHKSTNFKLWNWCLNQDFRRFQNISEKMYNLKFQIPEWICDRDIRIERHIWESIEKKESKK